MSIVLAHFQLPEDTSGNFHNIQFQLASKEDKLLGYLFTSEEANFLVIYLALKKTSFLVIYLARASKKFMKAMMPFILLLM